MDRVVVVVVLTSASSSFNGRTFALPRFLRRRYVLRVLVERFTSVERSSWLRSSCLRAIAICAAREAALRIGAPSSESLDVGGFEVPGGEPSTVFSVHFSVGGGLLVEDVRLEEHG